MRRTDCAVTANSAIWIFPLSDFLAERSKWRRAPMQAPSHQTARVRRLRAEFFQLRNEIGHEERFFEHGSACAFEI